MLGLEMVGMIEEVAEGEVLPPRLPALPARLRASHHAIARLDAKGFSTIEIAAQTGVSTSRISTLRECPSYQALIAHYRQDNDYVAEMVERKFQLIAEDTAQLIHEKVLDGGEDMSISESVEVFKTFADRAGFAPVHRTVNKNLNLNIGARLDAARNRKAGNG